ncbi:MAG TPA: NAD(P)-binding protein [Aeromicrobium sp.]|nr:NAD(P)-binding protein [Aeromicrobium sp.]HKY58192.1 NAD(P)-binding protein [Aeromicrobium sp.]
MGTRLAAVGEGLMAADVDDIEAIETDYLVIGAGAMGMAFVDVLLKQDRSAQVVVVDRHPAPGGHWNDAYPFVTLHQPAAFYGISSASLGSGGTDLASLPEIIAYYRAAMRRFEATGRVRFLAMSDYRDGVVTSILNPDRQTRVEARRRVVDATYHNVQVPSIVKPAYEVDDDVELIPPNELVRLTKSYEHYVVVGAGKTGIDAVLFLLNRGVSPDSISWIMPNDSWFWDRETLPPATVMGALIGMLQVAADLDSPDEMFAALAERGIVFRFDPDVRPTKWKCATVTRGELAELHRVTDVVRLGRVERISRGSIALVQGRRDVPENSLFIDCTADGLATKEPKPIFAPGSITLQSVFMCQQVFSAALIGRLETARMTDAERNRLVMPVPHPAVTEDLPRALLASAQNMVRCHTRVPWWLRRNRLFFGHHAARRRYLVASVNMIRYYRRALASGRWGTSTEGNHP